MTQDTVSKETLPKVEVVPDPDPFETFYQGSYYTISEVGGDIQEWIKGYTDMLNKAGIGTPTKFFYFTGEQMNRRYQLSGTVAYPKDLGFLAFPLEGLDTGKLAMFKLQNRDRWFDDIVDNNTIHMKEQNGWEE